MNRKLLAGLAATGLLVSGGGAAVGEEKILDVAFCAVLVVRLEERSNRADQPLAGVLKAALISREYSKVVVGEGGAVKVALLLEDSQSLEVPLPCGCQGSLLSGKHT